MRILVMLLASLLAAAAPLNAQRVILRVGQTNLSVASMRESASVVGALTGQLQWRVAMPGLEWTELELNAGTVGLPVRAVVARIDPKQFDFQLRHLVKANRVSGAWTIDSVNAATALAVNAGQFKEAGPWGWLVMRGETEGLPGTGTLAAGVAFDSAGLLHWIAPEQLDRVRRQRKFTYAFQSYPLLLLNDAVPRDLSNRKLVDPNHRDARLVLAQLQDGSLLLVLTRFDALGGRAERVPIGLTVPETLLLMRALSARHAVMLDGGISAQLLLRDAAGKSMRWPGLRAVPLALIATPRARSNF